MPKSDPTNWTPVGEPFQRDGAWWLLCRCACGNEREVRRDAFVHRQSTSCGKCGKLRDGRKRGYKHGGSGTKEYQAWFAIKDRCYNEANSEYHNYGGRGITMCARWFNDVATFLAVMGPKPVGTVRYCIERKKNNNGYWCGKSECSECGPAGREPNCVWDTLANGQRNRQNNRLVTHNGETKCVAEWAKQYDINPGVLAGRLDMQWSFERAVSEPIHSKDVLSEDQVRQILKDYRPNVRGRGPVSLAAEHGVSFQTIQRIVAGEIQKFRHLYDEHHSKLPPPDVIEDLRRLHERGRTIEELASLFNLPPETVSVVIG